MGKGEGERGQIRRSKLGRKVPFPLVAWGIDCLFRILTGWNPGFGLGNSLCVCTVQEQECNV